MRRVLIAFLFILSSSVLASAQQFTYYFPQVASGFFPGGAWKTTIFISNSSKPGTMASGVIDLTASDGTRMDITFVDDTGAPVGIGQIGFQLASGETRKFESVATGPLMTGYATVSATAAVLGTAMFTQMDASGRILSEAGVPSGIPLGRQAIFVDTMAGFRTGVAIANPNSAILHIHLELVNMTGQVIAAEMRDLGPLQQVAFFVDELFPGAPGMVGRLQFWCTNPMVSVGLRFDPTSTFFTTMPPIAISN